MFKLKKPCHNCPFRKGQGELFNLGVDRVLEIFNSPAFQCHKTVDYSDDERPCAGDHPQQCVGVMSLLHRADLPNQIMQVAERLGAVAPDYFDKLDHGAVYEDIADAIEAHSDGEDWTRQVADYAPHRQLITLGPATRGRMQNFKRAWERRHHGETRYQ